MFNSYQQQPPQTQNSQNLFHQQTGFVGQGQQTNRLSTFSGFENYKAGYNQNQVPQFPQQPLQQQLNSYVDMNSFQHLQAQHQPQEAQTSEVYHQEAQHNIQMPEQNQFKNIPSSQLGFVQPLNPQRTGIYSQVTQHPQLQSIENLKPNVTGFVDSFSGNGINKELNIPLVRLSFITPSDQAKFETLFRSFVKPGSNTISGSDCRTILLRSGLDQFQLAHIWTLCDTNRAGELLFPEFALAMHLVNTVLRGEALPSTLSSKIKKEISGFVDAINFSVVDEFTGKNKNHTSFSSLQPQPTGPMPYNLFGAPMLSQTTGGIDPRNSIPIQTTFNQDMQLQIQPTGNLATQVTGRFQAESMTQPQIISSLQSKAPIIPQTTGGIIGQSSILPQVTGSLLQTSLQSQLTGGTLSRMPLQNQLTSGFQSQKNGDLQFQSTGGLVPQLTGVSQISQNTGLIPQLSFGQSLLQQSSESNIPEQRTGGLNPISQPQAMNVSFPAQFDPTAFLASQNTGFRNNEIYNNINFKPNNLVSSNDKITSEEKALFYKMFETYDTQKIGKLHFSIAAEIFRKSGLSRSDLEHIWNLCDTNNSGQLDKEEFALGMHLIYLKLNGQALQSTLPQSQIPKSATILNNVKNQLKVSGFNDNRKELKKIDGLAFKHSDDETLPSFRNRRKSKIEENPTNEKEEQINSLKRSFERKRNQLIDEKLGLDRLQKTVKDQDEEARKAIENLKREILLSSNKASQYSGPTLQLKVRFESLSHKIPTLLNEISDIDNQITNAKLQLYRFKNLLNVVGSGSNGEITEYDKRKAKQKALLACRMADLTGIPVETASSSDIEHEKQKFSEEVTKIREEHEKNQNIINDIKSSITEISMSLGKHIYGIGDGDNYDPMLQKWELGIGLEPEVVEFIRNYRDKFKNETQKDYSEINNHSHTSHFPLPQTSLTQEFTMQKSLVSKNLSNFQNINQTRLPLKSSFGSPEQTKVSHPFVGYNSSKPIRDRSTYTENHFQPAKVDKGFSTNTTPNTENKVDAAAIEDEDEEEKKLREQLEALKLRKKAEREARLANRQDTSQLSKYETIATKPAKAQELYKDIDSSLGSNSKNSSTVFSNQITVPSSIKKFIGSTQVDNIFKQDTKKMNYTQSRHVNANAKTDTDATKSISFKNLDVSSSFDLEAAELQRRLQRGLDNSDGWSDDEEDKSHIDTRETKNNTNNSISFQIRRSPPSQQISGGSNSNVNEATAAVPIAPPLPSMTISSRTSSNSPVPIAPPLPQIISSSRPRAIKSTSTVPIASPLSKIACNQQNIQSPTNDCSVHLQSSQGIGYYTTTGVGSPAIPVAPPLPPTSGSNINSRLSEPAVPILHPPPQVKNSEASPTSDFSISDIKAAPTTPSLKANNQQCTIDEKQSVYNEDNESDLSIPESVNLDDEFHNTSIPSIHPPPHLP